MLSILPESLVSPMTAPAGETAYTVDLGAASAVVMEMAPAGARDPAGEMDLAPTSAPALV